MRIQIHIFIRIHIRYARKPARWFPFSSQTDQHEFHHSRNLGCFASKLNIYDKIFDSEKPYLEWRANRKASATTAVPSR